MPIYRFETRFKEHNDPRSRALLEDAHALGFTDLTRIECRDLYFIEGQLTKEELQQLFSGRPSIRWKPSFAM